MTTNNTDVSSPDDGTQSRYSQHSESGTAHYEGTQRRVDPESGNDLQTREPDAHDPQDGDPYDEEAAEVMGTSGSVRGTSEEKFSGEAADHPRSAPLLDKQSLTREGDFR